MLHKVENAALENRGGVCHRFPGWLVVGRLRCHVAFVATEHRHDDVAKVLLHQVILVEDAHQTVDLECDKRIFQLLVEARERDEGRLSAQSRHTRCLPHVGEVEKELEQRLQAVSVVPVQALQVDGDLCLAHRKDEHENDLFHGDSGGRMVERTEYSSYTIYMPVCQRYIMQIIPFSTISISSLVESLTSGCTLVYPTETCYGLGCDATNQSAVDQIFAIKKRQANKSVLVVMPSIEMIQKYVVWTKEIDRLAERYWPGPLTIVAPVKDNTGLARGVLAEDGTIAFRLSSHPLAQELSAGLSRPIVSTSANIAAMDSPYDIGSVWSMFDGQDAQPDIVIDAGDLPEQSPSTIVRVRGGKIEVLRQGDLVITDYA